MSATPANASLAVARAAPAAGSDRAVVRRRIRLGAIGLACLALAFYLGFILLLLVRSRH